MKKSFPRRWHIHTVL